MNKDWMTETAKRLNPDLPEGWRWVKAEAIKGGTLLQGGVCGKTKTGKTTYPKAKDMDKVLITSEQIKETTKIYEQETGFCCECLGTGKYVYGHSLSLGQLIKACPTCNETGKPLGDKP